MDKESSSPAAPARLDPSRGPPLHVPEIARRLDCTETWVYRLVAEKRIPHHRIAGRLVGGRALRGRIVIYERDFEAFLSACEVTVEQALEAEAARQRYGG